MKIFNYFILIFTLTYNLFANDLKPVNILETSGGVTDLVLDKNRLLAATVNSSIDIFDINSKEKLMLDKSHEANCNCSTSHCTIRS